MATDQLLYLNTTAPTVNDDSGDGYKVLDIWGDTTNDLIYIAIDVSVGAAVWVEITGRTLAQTLTNKTLTSAKITTGLEPTTNDGAALGTTTKQFSDLFLAEGGVINFDNGDATITQAGDVVTLAGADLKVTTPGTAATSVATIDGTQTLTNKTVNLASNTLTGTLEKFNNAVSDGGLAPHYKITPTVSSNDLVLTITHADGTTPSASRPLWFKIGNTWRSVTTTTSITLTDGTNFFNSGGVELGTQEIDYFAYIVWDSNSSIVAISCARFSYGRLVSDFNSTNTNEKYLGDFANFTSTDDVVVIGRFAATLSLTGTGHLWTVPTFSNVNLINEPIYETRWLNWQPVYSGSGSMTYTTVTTAVAKYKLNMNLCEAWFRSSGTTGGVASSTLLATLPFDAVQAASFPVGWGQANDGSPIAGRAGITGGTPDVLNVAKYDNSNWALAANKIINAHIRYEI